VRRKTRLIATMMLTAIVFAAQAYVLHYSPSAFSVVQVDGFDRIETGPDFTPLSPPGEPELPVQCLTYILPPGQVAVGVNVEPSDLVFLEGNILLYPAQPDVPIGTERTWVGPDSATYNQQGAYPACPVQVVQTGTLDGASMVTIAVWPVVYFPAQRELFVRSVLQFDFQLAPMDPFPDRPTVRGECAQTTYEQLLRATVENDQDVDLYYVRPALVAEGSIPQIIAPYPRPEEYTIVTTEALAPFYQPFADWLTSKGVPATVARVDHILPYFQGADDAERLREYIRLGWQTYGTVWVLLGADERLVPCRKGCALDFTPPLRLEDDENTPPSDLYFSDLSGAGIMTVTDCTVSRHRTAQTSTPKYSSAECWRAHQRR